jgi:ribonucleoside-diphosphate reductase alpha chain
MYKDLSIERKLLQGRDLLPKWFSTGGYQLFKEKYQGNAKSFRERVNTIAYTAAQHLPEYLRADYFHKFFNMIWNGWLSCSTPVLANMGTNRGMPVSCSGGVVDDSVSGFYGNLLENAVLTKHGFGTSAYVGDIRPRGSSISVGGKASGSLPVIKDLATMTMNISQGTARRGAIASYLPINHGDFWEVVSYLEREPDGLNIGWCIDDSFITDLNNGVTDALARYQRALKVKMVTGKGYFFFTDKVNRHAPTCYKDLGFKVKASNLCNEINLYSDKDHTFTCVLSSLNLAKYEEWANTTTIQDAIVFLDCVASEFIKKAKGIPELANAVRFTEKGRALGLGVCGLHTYLQKNNIPFESLDAISHNNLIFKNIRHEANLASVMLGELLGTPEWVASRRNTHLLAIAPTKSTALIMGGVSEGINPDPAMAFTQATAGGEVNRVNPVLLDLLKQKGVSLDKTINQVISDRGSVQNLDCLDDHEKLVFRTAFEINQSSIIRMASQRGKYIDQWQSLNLFFSSDTDPQIISDVHKEAFLDEGIRGLYYVYSKAGVSGSNGECIACQ